MSKSTRIEDPPRVIEMQDDGTAYWRMSTENPHAEDFDELLDAFAANGVDTFTQTMHSRWQAFYDSKVVEIVGDTSPEAVEPWHYTHYWFWATCVRRAIANGADPPKVLAEGAHRRGLKFLASLRLNDVHGILPHEGHYGSFRRDHPEWIIGEKSLDFGEVEVREHILSVARELIEGYDIDGLDIDFMRAPLYFRDDQVKANTPVMTELVRQIRECLDAASNKRGRRLLLSARVPLRLGEGRKINSKVDGQYSHDATECLGVGLDVPAWVRDGLIDVVCPMDYYYLKWTQMIDQMASWRRLTEGSACGLYPTIHGPWLDGYSVPYLCSASYRSAAHSFYERGADGMALYNVWNNEPKIWDAIGDMADPITLAGKPRRYHVYLDEPVVVEEGGHGQVAFLIPEDPRAEGTRSALRFFAFNLTMDHRVEFDLNGTKIEHGDLCFERKMGSKPGAPSQPYGYRVTVPMRKTTAVEGTNTLGVKLIGSNPQIADLPDYQNVPATKGGIALARVEALFETEPRRSGNLIHDHGGWFKSEA